MINYKKLIPGRGARIKIMQAFNWIPDKTMLSLQYRIKTGRKLHWKDPQRFTEKLQIYKIKTKKDPLMADCADKAAVRDFIAGKGLSEILIPLVGAGVYESADAVNFDALPDRFVLKDTEGCGGNSVIVCQNKAELDAKETKKRLAAWVKKREKHPGREHVYDRRKHRIIAESFLDASGEPDGLVDYKFFCFDGKPEYIYALSNRTLGKGAELGIYDADFNLLPYVRADEMPPSHALPKPPVFDRMKEIAGILSADFPEVRVDLYCVGGKIYFGELTFFDGSGYMTYAPDEFDFMIGKPFHIHF